MAVSTSTETLVGSFDSDEEARQAVRELRNAGFVDSHIGVVSHHKGEGNTGSLESGTKVEEGAAIGAATGAGLGALWGLGILAGVLPGIGPAIVGGTLGILLSSAAAGAAAAGIGAALVGLGIPEDEAQFYEGEFKSGRTLVTVKASRNPAMAESILTRNGAHTHHARS